jgi:hypothetical protein
VLLTNIRSIRYKFDDLTATISAKNPLPQIVAITETWLSSNDCSNYFNIPIYGLPVRCDRADRSGGGTAVWVHRSLGFYYQFHPSGNLPINLECIFISIRKLRILFVCIYISGSQLPANNYVDIFEYLVTSVDEFLNSATTYNVMLCGDFNTVFIDNHLNDLCISLSLNNIVNTPTRGDSIIDLCVVSATIIDLFHEPIVGPPIMSSYGVNSDHGVVLVSPKSGINNEGILHTIYDFRESHIANFIQSIMSYDFNSMYLLNSVDEKAKFLQNALSTAFKLNIPFKHVVMCKNDKDWLTPKIKNLINDRWMAYRLKNWPLFIHLKNKVKNQIHIAKKNWANKASHSSRNFWNIVSSISGKNSKSTFPIPSDWQVFVNSINDNFASNFNHRDFNFDLPDLGYDDWSPTVSEQWVFNEILTSNSGKAMGSDCIPIRLYKAAAHIICLPIAHIINCTFVDKSIPDLWKFAHIIPIPKSSPPVLDNLRPISSLSFPAKLMEKAVLFFMNDRLLSFVDKYQFAYRPLSSTTNILIRIHDFVTTILDRKDSKAVSLLFLDLEKAFDSIPHKLLLKKMYALNLPLGFLHWVQNYLSGRTQSTRYMGFHSNISSISSGVPQGSLIGPVLFSIFLQDLNIDDLNIPSNCLIVKYADDTVLACGIFDDVNITIDSLDIVSNYCDSNFLKINNSKSYELVISKLNFDPSTIPLTVKRVNKIKYLGLIFNSHFNWDSHIDFITAAASRRIFCLRTLKVIFNRDQLISVYCSVVRSILEYASPVFCKLNQSHIVKINRVQKRVHSLICCNLSTCNILPDLSDRRLLASKKLFNKITSNNNHLLSDILPRTLPSGRFEIPFCNTTRRQNSFILYCLLAN